MRALTRAREGATQDLKAAKFRLKALLLRHDSRYTGRANWGPAPLRWLSEVVVAVAREWVGFIWAIAKQVDVKP